MNHGQTSIGLTDQRPSVRRGRTTERNQHSLRSDADSASAAGRGGHVLIDLTEHPESVVSRLELVTVSRWTLSVQLTCTAGVGPCARSVPS
jgi:hypothetical protein